VWRSRGRAAAGRGQGGPPCQLGSDPARCSKNAESGNLRSGRRTDAWRINRDDDIDQRTAGHGGAFDGQNANVAFGSQAITGATATAVNYALDSNGEHIQDVTVTLTGDVSTTDHPKYVFTGSLTDASDQQGSGVANFPGTCTAAASEVGGSTVITCDFTTAPENG
jgi:hypothetical protein